MKDQKLNREATIQNIVEKAGDKIKNIDSLKAKDDEFLIDSADLWGVEAVYE